MDYHPHARLTIYRREELAKNVLEGRQSAAKWVRRLFPQPLQPCRQNPLPKRLSPLRFACFWSRRKRNQTMPNQLHPPASSIPLGVKSHLSFLVPFRFLITM